MFLQPIRIKAVFRLWRGSPILLRVSARLFWLGRGDHFGLILYSREGNSSRQKMNWWQHHRKIKFNSNVIKTAFRCTALSLTLPLRCHLVSLCESYKDWKSFSSIKAFSYPKPPVHLSRRGLGTRKSWLGRHMISLVRLLYYVIQPFNADVLSKISISWSPATTVPSNNLQTDVQG